MPRWNPTATDASARSLYGVVAAYDAPAMLRGRLSSYTAREDKHWENELRRVDLTRCSPVSGLKDWLASGAAKSTMKPSTAQRDLAVMVGGGYPALLQWHRCTNWEHDGLREQFNNSWDALSTEALANAVQRQPALCHLYDYLRQLRINRRSSEEIARHRFSNLILPIICVFVVEGTLGVERAAAILAMHAKRLVKLFAPDLLQTDCDVLVASFGPGAQAQNGSYVGFCGIDRVASPMTSFGPHGAMPTPRATASTVSEREGSNGPGNITAAWLHALDDELTEPLPPGFAVDGQGAPSAITHSGTTTSSWMNYSRVASPSRQPTPILAQPAASDEGPSFLGQDQLRATVAAAAAILASAPAPNPAPARPPTPAPVLAPAPVPGSTANAPGLAFAPRFGLQVENNRLDCSLAQLSNLAVGMAQRGDEGVLEALTINGVAIAASRRTLRALLYFHSPAEATTILPLWGQTFHAVLNGHTVACALGYLHGLVEANSSPEAEQVLIYATLGGLHVGLPLGDLRHLIRAGAPENLS